MNSYSMKIEMNSAEWVSFQQEPLEIQSIINSYMTEKCVFNNELTQDHTINCENYHNEAQNRRKPFKNGCLVYKSEICTFNSRFCGYFENCNKCHNAYEYTFHPDKFRTSMCNFLNCHKFGKICPFSHSVDTLRNTYLSNSSKLNLINNKYNFCNSNMKLPLNSLSNKPPIHTIFKKLSINDESNKTEGTGLKECDLSNFKVYACNIYSKHNEKQCLFFHSAKDFRRMISKVKYSSELCKFAEAGKLCPNGEFCLKSHSRVEQFYHPEKFKSKFCSHYNNISYCLYGKYCSFAHSETESKVELIHKFEQNENYFIFYFKSVWCPFNHTHDKSICAYSHNWQDYRRSPLNYIYSERMCSNWDNKKTILNYHEGCFNEYQCNGCHGWKEHDYHPFVFKTRKCKYLKEICSKGVYCPFYHNNERKREINLEIKNSLTREIEIKSQGKTVIVNNIDNNIQISMEVANNSDLGVFHRNFEISLIDRIRCFRNNSFNVYNQPILDNNNNSVVITNPEPNQISINNSDIIANVENKISNPNISSTNIMERSNSIFSNSSSNSIKIHNKMNPRISIIQKLHSSSKNQKSKDSQQCSLNLPETIYNDDKLEDIKDNEELSEDSNFEENLDSSGEFTKMMKKQDNQKKNSIRSKNLSTFERTNSMYSLSLSEIHRLKEVYINNQLYNDSSLKEKETSFDNYNNKDRSSVDYKYREQILDYLKINNYSMIYQKMYKNEITAKDLLKLEEDKIVEMVEIENKEKFPNLIKFIMNLEDSCDYDDIFKKIDNDIFNGQS